MDNHLTPEMIILGAFGLILIAIALFGDRISWLGKGLFGGIGLAFITIVLVEVRATAGFY